MRRCAVCGRGPGGWQHTEPLCNEGDHRFVDAGDPSPPGVTAETPLRHPVKRSIYIIGSMRNPRVPEVAKALRSIGWDAFDEWYSSGPEADDKWQEYERARGRSYREAASGYHARNAFELDKHHLDRCDAAILVMPAGRSAHNEKGYMEGRGKPTYLLLDGEPERYDIMPPNFATAVFVSIDEMLEGLK